MSEHIEGAKTTGCLPTPNKIISEHFEWLVLFQIRKMEAASIKKTLELDQVAQAVTNGIRDAAKLVVGPQSSTDDEEDKVA